MKQAINLICVTHNRIGSSATPLRTFTVAADWRGHCWKPTWHPKSVWYVSVYQTGELCTSAPANAP